MNVKYLYLWLFLFLVGLTYGVSIAGYNIERDNFRSILGQSPEGDIGMAKRNQVVADPISIIIDQPLVIVKFLWCVKKTQRDPYIPLRFQSLHDQWGQTPSKNCAGYLSSKNQKWSRVILWSPQRYHVEPCSVRNYWELFNPSCVTQFYSPQTKPPFCLKYH